MSPALAGFLLGSGYVALVAACVVVLARLEAK